MKSLGLLEISGVTAAVTALDIMCKTADVEFVTWERKLGGRLVTIIVQGDVSAVRQAVEAAAANGIKKPVNYTVIARPHEEIIRLVELSASRMKLKKAPVEPKKAPKAPEKASKTQEKVPVEPEKAPKEPEEPAQEAPEKGGN